ncbi:hypothetical protein H0H81_006401 [Sphagnurus paluster]|uniref:Uncharacterized protein n=1 Tax=Sphagnurus paluster TaxID=117069 RepID=A0A9P7G1M7_9AGAR|nr:hypothetical protein H0H81_006401 [Sphagnurus paluster]
MASALEAINLPTYQGLPPALRAIHQSLDLIPGSTKLNPQLDVCEFSGDALLGKMAMCLVLDSTESNRHFYTKAFLHDARQVLCCNSVFAAILRKNNIGFPAVRFAPDKQLGDLCEVLFDIYAKNTSDQDFMTSMRETFGPILDATEFSKYTASSLPSRLPSFSLLARPSVNSYPGLDTSNSFASSSSMKKRPLDAEEGPSYDGRSHKETDSVLREFRKVPKSRRSPPAITVTIFVKILEKKVRLLPGLAGLKAKTLYLG